MSSSDERFRRDLRAWLSEHTPPDVAVATTRAEADRLRDWQRTLHRDGWVGIHWPTEHGGRGASPTQVVIYHEELARVAAPPLFGRVGLTLVGPTLLTHGTVEQRAEWMPRILTGEDIWCQLFSEPGAGSDLASLSTRAVEGAGGWHITGQKVWSSYAEFADLGICLARTDPAARPHQGISMFAIPMDAPGVEIRPLRQMTGAAEFNEVFLADVVVSADGLIGPRHGGWQVANTTLANERGASFIWNQQLAQAQALDALVTTGRRLGVTADPVTRQRLAGARIESEIFGLHNRATLAGIARGEPIGSESSLVKLFWAQSSQQLAQRATALLGAASLLTTGGGPNDGADWVHELLATRANSIMGGTSEIQRTIIGERLLGLPREPRA